MQEAFFNEAVKHYHLENNRASLPTAQGLIVLFMASAFLSRDGAAASYRNLGYDMIDRLQIDNKFSTTTDEAEIKAYSTALWGIYCCENIVANLHNKRPERQAPTLPRLFERKSAVPDNDFENVDIFGQPFTSSSYRPSFTPGVLNAACDLAVLQHAVINHNFDVRENGASDNFGMRLQQYRTLQKWESKVPPELRNDINNTPGTAFLSVHCDIIALFILRPLDPRTVLPGEGTSLGLRIMHCQRIITLVENHFRDHLAGDYSTLFLAGLFHACLTLIPSLSSAVSAELFTRAAMLLHRTVVDLPGMRQILRGVQAVVWGMRKSLPEGARASFEQIEPPSDTVESDPDAGVKDLQGLQGRLGEMIELWEEDQEQLSARIGSNRHL
ncbi:hypothetical protein E8E12_003605 [Didymella heteroderae]|uniref:Transcription factor domain-containing protein n=1 Tax=Didymella heteroderae TaxID=1769908 RepID=A0A9P5C0N9_9PLEO|nr:hypothetical protein E8E12_003605 [Didymella heteroderae]